MGSLAVIFQPGLSESEEFFLVFCKFDHISTGVGPFQNHSTFLDNFGFGSKNRAQREDNFFRDVDDRIIL